MLYPVTLVIVLVAEKRKNPRSFSASAISRFSSCLVAVQLSRAPSYIVSPSIALSIVLSDVAQLHQFTINRMNQDAILPVIGSPPHLVTLNFFASYHCHVPTRRGKQSPCPSARLQSLFRSATGESRSSQPQRERAARNEGVQSITESLAYIMSSPAAGTGPSRRRATGKIQPGRRCVAQYLLHPLPYPFRCYQRRRSRDTPLL